ncbi:hypothetical protein CRG98_031653 [Punica granatum]|nr:hypothetical protein CRG98_031653 [Punica granatum]
MVDRETFWGRYFYRVDKLKQAEDARARLVKRAISGDEDEDLRWDFDDDGNGEEGEGSASNSKNGILESVKEGSSQVAGEEVSEELRDDKSDGKIEEKEKVESVESCKDSDVSIVSTQPSIPEEDLGWDEIEDMVSNDESRGDGGASSSASRVDLRKRLSAAEEEEDLSWDIEEDDEPPKAQ